MNYTAPERGITDDRAHGSNAGHARLDIARRNDSLERLVSQTAPSGASQPAHGERIALRQIRQSAQALLAEGKTLPALVPPAATPAPVGTAPQADADDETEAKDKGPTVLPEPGNQPA